MKALVVLNVPSICNDPFGSLGCCKFLARGYEPMTCTLFGKPVETEGALAVPLPECVQATDAVSKFGQVTVPQIECRLEDEG